MATSGAHPLATFPNDHMKTGSAAAANYVPPQPRSMVQDLRDKLNSTDWAGLFRDGKTMFKAEANWSASEERCLALQQLCKSSRARKVLEIGAFCGVGTLSIAEALPSGGLVTSLELDPYLVEFGKSVISSSGHSKKIKHCIGSAKDSLQAFSKKASSDDWENGPFDVVIIDADKEGMKEYFNILWETPGMLSEAATVCVDITTFKGQLFTPYVKSGKADQWIVSSGIDQVHLFQKFVKSDGKFSVTQVGNLMFTKRNASKSGRGRSRSPDRGSKNVSIGANPLATFANERMGGGGIKWAPPKNETTVQHIRRVVNSTDWGALFAEGKTKMRVDSTWSANEKRCETLVELCKSASARRILEIGACCGVATMTMAEQLPEDGEIVALEFDPFLVEYTKDIIAQSEHSIKVQHKVGPAKDSLEDLAKMPGQFDLVLVDADKASVAEYFHLLWDTPGLLIDSAAVCVDMTPFKGQLFTQQFVKSGKPDEWVVHSGQEQLDALRSTLKASKDFEFSEHGGLLVTRKRR